MNVYDKANDLADAIKHSSEFNRYKDAAKKIQENETHQKMLKDFMEFQYKMYMAQMNKQEPDEKMVSDMNTLYQTISNVTPVKEFLESQMYFARLMEDINKTIAEAADPDVDFLKDMIGGSK